LFATGTKGSRVFRSASFLFLPALKQENFFSSSLLNLRFSLRHIPRQKYKNVFTLSIPLVVRSEKTDRSLSKTARAQNRPSVYKTKLAVLRIQAQRFLVFFPSVKTRVLQCNVVAFV
jgi:hypothetical protein